MDNTKSAKPNRLGTEPVGRLVRQFAVPSIISMLVGALYNIVDQFFIGRKIGELGNAATNVAFPLSTICLAIALLFGIGSAASFNLSMGRGDKERAPYYIAGGAFMLTACGIILCIIVQLFLTPLLILFGSPDNVLGYARDYTSITSLGFPFLLLATGGGHLIRADGSPKIAMLSNLLGAVINTVLDPLLIFTFNMDMKGAAIATVVGQVISACTVFVYLMHYKTVKLEKKHILPKWEYLKSTISLGMSSALNQIAITIVQITMNNSLTYYGAQSVYGASIPLACAGIITKINQIYFSVVIGLSQAIQPVVSFNYGAQNYSRVKQAYKLAVLTGTAVSILAFAAFQIFPRKIISLFGSGNELYMQFAESYFKTYLFFTFLNAVQPTASTFFTSIGKPGKGIFLSLTRQIIFLLPLIVVLPLFMGIDGILYAGPTADFAAAAASIAILYIEMKNMGK